VTGVHSFVFCL